ncbi:MAG: crosslink repair DNA glycosylase YcaQ family protein [Myxococcota bacterium]
MNQRIEKFTLKAIQSYHHTSLIHFDDQETLVEALASRIGFAGANPVAFLSILARRPEMRLNDLDEAILTDRTLVRANSFRNSLFLMASVDYPLYFRALSHPLKMSNQSKLNAAGIDEDDLLRMHHRLEDTNFHIPQSHEQVMEILYPKNHALPVADVQKLLVRKLCELGVLVRTYHKGWKGNDFLYALTKNWFPDFKLTSENQETARCQLIRRYISTYGPVSKEDIIWWTGLSESQVHRSLSTLRRELSIAQIEGHKDEMLVLKERVQNIRQHGNSDHSIVFLPPFDPFTTAWVTRKRTAKKSDYPFIYDAVGNAAGTIVHEGKIIGVWQFRDSKDHIFEYHLFESYQDLKGDVHFLADQYAHTLARISGSTATYVYERKLPEPLHKRPPGSFLWPLGKEPPFKTADQNLLKSPLERRTSNTFRRPYLKDEHVAASASSSAPAAATCLQHPQ